jgi:hypothetical protein
LAFVIHLAARQAAWQSGKHSPVNPIHHDMNRREILRTTSLSSLGLLAARTIPTALGQERSKGANEKDPDRHRGILGSIGAGACCRRIMAVAADFNTEIVGVSDLWSVRRDDAKAWFKKHMNQDIATYRNNEELYEKAKPDAVIISTADFQHALHAIEAVKAGCDVYCEKPFAETMQDARAALKAVRESKRILQVGSQRQIGKHLPCGAEIHPERAVWPDRGGGDDVECEPAGPLAAAGSGGEAAGGGHRLETLPDESPGGGVRCAQVFGIPAVLAVFLRNPRAVDVPPDRYDPLVHRAACTRAPFPRMAGSTSGRTAGRTSTR